MITERYNREDDYNNQGNGVEYVEEFVSFLVMLWQKKFRLIIFFFSVFVLSCGVTLFIPNRYTAEAVVLPSGSSSGVQRYCLHLV